MIQKSGRVLWILQGHTVSFALVEKVSLSYIPAASFLKLLGLRANSDSFGFLSECFLCEFTYNQRLFHTALLQMPGTNHMAGFLMAALILLRGSLSRKHHWKNKAPPTDGGSKVTINSCGRRGGHWLDNHHHYKGMIKYLKVGACKTLPNLQFHIIVP